MKEYTEKAVESVETLRSRMDADARFRRVFSGYDPEEVRAYIEDVRHVYAKQAKAAKQEQESLISQLDSARSELQARNFAIRSLKETLAHRENMLSSADQRVSTLIKSVRELEGKQISAEAKKEVEARIQAAEARAQAAETRAQATEAEAQQLRSTLHKAANLIETWKNERVTMKEENERLRQEATSMLELFKTFTEEMKTQLVQTSEQKESMQAVSTQIADTFADAFAEAYDLVDTFRSKIETKERGALRPAQSRMQVLRPSGTVTKLAQNAK